MRASGSVGLTNTGLLEVDVRSLFLSPGGEGGEGRPSSSLLVESVETGTEEVIVGKADKGIIDSKVISAANKKLGRKGNLTLSKTSGSMAGGFILRRGKVDLNLSFDGLVEHAREGLETEVAKLLFEQT